MVKQAVEREKLLNRMASIEAEFEALKEERQKEKNELMKTFLSQLEKELSHKETKETLLKVLEDLLDWSYKQICTHENTHRGGILWEICDDCGARWADDRGGRPEFEYPKEVVKAEEVISKYKE